MRTTLTRQQASDFGKLRLGKYRQDQRHFVIEGERLVGDALQAGADLALAVVDTARIERFSPLLARIEEAGIPLYEATATLLGRMTDTRQPQGIAAVAALPALDARETLTAVPEGRPATALWGISNPGNFGTVIRTADWFGCRGLLFSQGSVDPFNPKTVRATMGSLFRVRLGTVGDADELLALAAACGREPVAAVADGGIALDDWNPSGRELLVLGSEAHGLPAELLERIPSRIRIPGSGAESLNLAVSHGILLHSLSAR